MTTFLSANPASVADRMILQYLNKKLLEVQEDELVMDQFAVKAELPRNAAAKTMRFFKPEKAAAALRSAPTDATTAALNVLTEGVAPTTYRENVFTKIDVTLRPYGQVTKISDVTTLLDAYEPLKQNVLLMRRDANLAFDTCNRNALVGGTHPSGSGAGGTHLSSETASMVGCELFATATPGSFVVPAVAGNSATFFTNLSSATKAQGKLTRAGVLAAATRLKLSRAPKLKGKFAFAICPQHAHDLVQDADYKQAFQGQGGEGPWRGSMGSIDGFNFVEHTNPYIEDETYGTYDAVDDDGDGLIYTSFAIGANAYSNPRLQGTSSPNRPQIVIVDKADSGNPLQQFVLAGWKAFYMAVLLDTDNIVAIRAKSTYA